MKWGYRRGEEGGKEEDSGETRGRGEGGTR